VDHVSVPVGVVCVPASVSLTVAVQDVVSPAFSVDGVHETTVVVVRLVTVRTPVATALVGLEDGLKFDPPLKVGVMV
jgi:hypothetical protein